MKKLFRKVQGFVYLFIFLKKCFTIGDAEMSPSISNLKKNKKIKKRKSKIFINGLELFDICITLKLLGSITKKEVDHMNMKTKRHLNIVQCARTDTDFFISFHLLSLTFLFLFLVDDAWKNK